MKKLLLSLGAVAAVAAPVATVVACGSTDSTGTTVSTDVTIKIANTEATGQFAFVENNADVSGNAATGTAAVQVGDAETNHPVRVIFTAEEGKKLFASADVAKGAMDSLNGAYVGSATAVLNTEAFSGDDSTAHTGWLPFFIGERKGTSHHFGFDAGTTDHFEIILNYKTEALAKAATAASVQKIIDATLKLVEANNNS